MEKENYWSNNFYNIKKYGSKYIMYPTTPTLNIKEAVRNLESEYILQRLYIILIFALFGALPISRTVTDVDYVLLN